MPVSRIVINVGVVHVRHIVLNTHVEKTIVAFGNFSLSLVSCMPTIIRIAPFAVVLLLAPRISDYEESVSWGQFQQIKNNI